MEASGGVGGKEHEGDRYLRLLGLEHLGKEPITTKDGDTIEARDFLDLDVCAKHARPLLRGFETMKPDDPEYKATRKALRKVVSKYVEGPRSE